MNILFWKVVEKHDRFVASICDLMWSVSGNDNKSWIVISIYFDGLFSNLEGMKITIRGFSKNCICKVGGKIALLIKRLLLFNHSQPFGTEGLITILAQEYNCFLYRPYTCIAFMTKWVKG